MDEARLDDTKYGRGPVTEGWFVVNLRDAAWMHSPKFGSACIIETEVSFPQIGYTIAVLGEGGSSGLYHREDDQEDQPRLWFTTSTLSPSGSRTNAP